MPLVDARGFSLTPDILGSLARGSQAVGQFRTQGLQEQFLQQRLAQQQLEQQQQAQQLGNLSRIKQLLGSAGQQAPQTQQQTQLAAQTADFNPLASDALSQQVAAEQPQILSQDDMIRQARQIDPVVANKILKDMGLDDATKRAEASRFAAEVQFLPLEQQNQRILERVQDLRAQGRSSKDTLELLDMPPAQRIQALQGVQMLDLSTKERFAAQERAAKKIEIPAGQREFEAKTKGLTKEQKNRATLIDLGLEPRAVGSAIQTISEKGIQNVIGDASATIKQREKFGEMSGASRAKSIDLGFEKIQKIDLGINTIDRAIAALEGGANTGAIQKFLPSFRAASVELDNIQKQFALDVIGSVTLGAISEAELDLAKQVGLPTGLDEPQLIKHLQDRRAAQLKLKAIYLDQINFLDQGGTIAGYLRNLSRKKEPDTAPPTGFVED